MENIKETGKIIITFGVLLDESGKEHVNLAPAYKIDSEGDRIPVKAAISASMYITEHFIELLNTNQNEDSLQLEESETGKEATGNGSISNNTQSDANS